MSQPLRHYRESTGGDAQLLAAVTRTFREHGSAAAFAAINDPSKLGYNRRVTARPRLQLRALAGATRDPQIRRDELRRRAPRTMTPQQAKNRLRLHELAMMADVEQRGFNPETVLCAACGGRVPISYPECACGASMMAERSWSASRRSAPEVTVELR